LPLHPSKIGKLQPPALNFFLTQNAAIKWGNWRPSV